MPEGWASHCCSASWLTPSCSGRLKAGCRELGRTRALLSERQGRGLSQSAWGSSIKRGSGQSGIFCVLLSLSLSLSLTHTQTHTHAHTNTHRHTQAHTQRHTDIHTHTDTHTHTRSPQGACIWQKGMPAEVLKSMESHGLAPVECFSALWNDSLFVHTALPERLYLCHHGGRKSKG